MITFVDTSALYALLDAGDENHERASAWFSGPARADGATLMTHNYVVVETAALVHRRIGAEGVRALLEDLIPVLDVAFVDEPLHRAAASAFLAGARRGLSLVDWASFELMRYRGILLAFAFDRDFERAGFSTVP